MSAGLPSSWRESVSQSFRSEEVRSIARVLATIEPGATASSKTMLAMRFEESIFRTASDLDDYRKKIKKRIKAVQKAYTNGGRTIVDDVALTSERESLLERQLRDTYGQHLIYILSNGDRAVQMTREKPGGDKKADTLQQSLAYVRMWSAALNIPLPNGETHPSVPMETEGGRMAQLTKIQGYLDTRLSNIRAFIIQTLDKDLFIEETFLKLVDKILLKNEIGERILRNSLMKADLDDADFSENRMKQLVEHMNAPIPIPRRNQDGDKLRAALARVEKVRAAIQAMYTYMGLSISDKIYFRESIVKCFAVVKECLNDLDDDCKILVKNKDKEDDDGKRIVPLEDAWNNPLQLSEQEKDDHETIDPERVDNEMDPMNKRQKTNEVDSKKFQPAVPLVIRSKILLTPERNVLSSLLPALKRKRASLIRRGREKVIRLEFGKAFEMTIYFVPLLVDIRAIADDMDYDNEVPSDGGLYWPSFHQGLHPPAEPRKEHNLTVLGVTGSHETLGSIIASKLEYASSQATYVLRRCFAESTLNQSSSSRVLSDFEIEILEVGALIKFLRIARTTYMPDWVDDDP